MQNVHELRDADHRTKHERVAALSNIILFVLVEPRPALARMNQQRAAVIRRPFAVLDQFLPAHDQGGVGLANCERLHAFTIFARCRFTDRSSFSMRSSCCGVLLCLLSLLWLVVFVSLLLVLGFCVFLVLFFLVFFFVFLSFCCSLVVVL